MMTVSQIHENLVEQLKRFLALGDPKYVTAAKAMCRAAGISEEEVRLVMDESVRIER